MNDMSPDTPKCKHLNNWNTCVICRPNLSHTSSTEKMAPVTSITNPIKNSSKLVVEVLSFNSIEEILSDPWLIPMFDSAISETEKRTALKTLLTRLLETLIHRGQRMKKFMPPSTPFRKVHNAAIQTYQDEIRSFIGGK